MSSKYAKPNKFTKYLAKTMKDRGLGNNQLASLSGISASEVSRLMSGERKKPNPRILRKLAPILRVSFEELTSIAYPEKGTGSSKEAATERISQIPESQLTELAKEIAKYTTREISPEYKTQDVVPVIGYINADNILSPKEIKHDQTHKIDNADFAVIVKGDSLSYSGVISGDIVYLKKKEAAKNGDLVLANCGGKHFLRYYQLTKPSRVSLIPSNPKYNRVDCADIKLIGIQVGLLRK